MVTKDHARTLRQAEIRRSFGRRIKRQAQELGLSLRQIAEIVEMDPSFLSRIVAGTRNPPNDELIEHLAKALQMPPEELLVEAGRIPELPEGTRKALPDFFRASKDLSESQIRTVLTVLETLAQTKEQ